MALEQQDNAERSIKPKGGDTATLLRPSSQEMQAHFPVARSNQIPEPVSLDFGSALDLYGKGNVIVQNFDDYTPPPTLLPDPEVMRIVGEATSSVAINAYKYGFEHPYRGREMSNIATIPETSYSQAFSAFPELQGIGKLSEQGAEQLMKAIIANELDHYDWRDRLTDSMAMAAHGQSKFGEITVGYSQISVKGVQNLAGDFQKEFEKGERATNPLAKYLKMSPEQILKNLSDPRELPLLVAANLAHNIGMYDRNHYPINEQTLGYGFNPDLPPQKPTEGHELLPPTARLNKSKHAHNVSVWLQQIRDAESGK